MIEQFRRFLQSTAGKIAAIVVTLGLLGLAVYTAKAFIKGDTPSSAFHSMYVCSETGKAFDHVLQMGDTIPILSPYSGKNTGYPAEACYWTKDGKVKTEPTWLLLNSQLGLPEPTFCPDCGRLVVVHNPQATEGRRPPPTKEEWEKSHPPSADATP